MARKKKSEDASKAAEPKFPEELLDQLITCPITQNDFDTIYRAPDHRARRAQR